MGDDGSGDDDDGDEDDDQIEDMMSDYKGGPWTSLEDDLAVVFTRMRAAISAAGVHDPGGSVAWMNEDKRRSWLIMGPRAVKVVEQTIAAAKREVEQVQDAAR